MRILVVCQYYYPENVVITPICEELVARGHSVLAVTGKPNYGFNGILPEYVNVDDETIRGVRIHRCPLKPRGNTRKSLIANYLSFCRSSTKYLKNLKEEFDVVYSMEMSPIISVNGANIYAKLHHVPHILHCLDLWPESVVATRSFKKDSLPYKFLYKWSKKIYGGASKILISSPSFARYFHDVLKIEKPISFVPQPPLIPESRDLPIVYPTPYTFVYAGNIGSLQLISNFVKACVPFKDRKDFSFYIVGNGRKEDEVKQLIKDLGLLSIIHHHDTVPPSKCAAYFPNATALIVPLAKTASPVSWTIPNKLISSLYYGKPILACIKGDGAVILDRAGGSIFATESPEDITKAFNEFMSTNKEKLALMGANNRKYFDANFAFNGVLDQLEEELKVSIKG